MTNTVSSKGKHRRSLSFRNVANILEEDSCVLCSMLRQFHIGCIQYPHADHIQALCDLHAWAIAEAADTGAAARILLRLLLLEQQQLQASASCSVCECVAEEEINRSDQLILLLKKDPEFQEWIRDHGAVCIPHARKLLSRIPEWDRHVVLALVAKAAARLKYDLRQIADDADSRSSSLSLSQAAEFLKGRRGLARPCS